jgi:hypothetical protein
MYISRKFCQRAKNFANSNKPLVFYRIVYPAIRAHGIDTVKSADKAALKRTIAGCLKANLLKYGKKILTS